MEGERTATSAPTSAYVWSAPVPYFQFDQQGVVFNMWYFAWCDEASAGYLRHIGAPHDALIAAGHDQHLAHAEIDWISPLRAGEGEVSIAVSTERVGTSSFELGFTIGARARVGLTRQLAQARIVYVNVVAGTPTPLPRQLRTALDG